jgi:hypothetical protein
MRQLHQVLYTISFHAISILTTKVGIKTAHSFKYDNFISFLAIYALIITAIFAVQSWAVATTFRTVKRQCWNEKVSVSVSHELFPFQCSWMHGPRINGSLVRLAAIYFFYF